MPVFTIETPSGQKLDIEAADQATAIQGAQKWHSDNTPSTGIAAGFKQGVSDLIRGDSQTSQYALGTDGSAQGAADAIAPKNYQSPPILGPDSHWYDPTSYNWKNVPQKMAEMAPGVAQDLAVGRTAAKLGPAVGLAAGLGSFAYRTFGPEAKQAAEARTGDASAQPTAVDLARGAGATAAMAVPQALGIGRFIPGMTAPARSVMGAVGKLGTTVAAEGASGALANAGEQAAQTIGTPGGLSVDPNKVAEAGVAQGIGGGVMGAPGIPAALINAAKYSKFNGDMSTAATNVGNRLVDHAGGRDLGDTTVGADAVHKASSAISNELGTAVKSLTTPLTPEAQSIVDNAQAGRMPTVKDYSTLQSALAADPNGKAVTDLVREQHAMSMLKDTGELTGDKFIGGAARHVPSLLGLSGHGIAKAVLASAAIEHFGSHLIAMSPAAIGIGGAVYGGLRGLDNFTGARSPAERFANRFADGNGVQRSPLAGPAQPQAPQRIVPPNAQPVAPPMGGPGNPWGPAPRPSGQVPIMPPAPAPQAAPPVAPAPGTPAGRQAIAQTMPYVQKLARQAMLQKQAMVQQSAPLLRQLAATEGPNSPAAQPPAPEAPAAPAPAPIDPLALPKDMLAKAKVIMSAHANVAKMRDAALGQQQADEAVKTSPLIDQLVGGAQNVPDPATAKAMKQALGGAAALAKLQSDPAAAAEQAATQKAEAAQVKSDAADAKAKAKAEVKAQAAAAKITKTNGTVKVSAPAAEEKAAPQADAGHVPLTPDEMPYKGMSPARIAEAEAQKYRPAIREVYKGKIEQSQTLRNQTLTELAMQHPNDEAPLGGLLDELKHYSRSQKASVSSAIDHYTRMMTPEGAAATRAKLNNEFISKVWGK